MMIRSLIFCGAGMLSMAAVAAPNINIGTMYDYLEGERSTLLKRVRNAGDSTAFVRVSIAEVTFSESGEPQEKVTAAVSLDQRQIGATLEPAAEYQESISAGVTMLMGYGAMLFVAPKRPHYHTDVVEEGQKIIVRNKGNATVVLADFHACEIAGKECGVPAKYHVLPGRKREFAKEAGHEYRFKLHEGKRDKTFEFAG